MPKFICPNCGYEWTSRVEKPKSCPCCKRYITVPEKMRMKRLKSITVLEPEVTGIFFDCTRCGARDKARFRFKKELLCHECMIEKIKETKPVEIPEMDEPQSGG